MPGSKDWFHVFFPASHADQKTAIFKAHFLLSIHNSNQPKFQKIALEVAFPVKTVKNFHPHLQVEDVSIKTEFDWQLLPFPMSLYKSEPGESVQKNDSKVPGWEAFRHLYSWWFQSHPFEKYATVKLGENLPQVSG